MPHREYPLSLVAFVFVAALSACSGSSGDAKMQGGPPSSVAEVGYVVVHPQDVTISSDVAGRVAALRTAEIRPQVEGLIKERVFAEGKEVKEGDVLYRIDAETYEAAVEAAEATLQKAEAAASGAKAKADRYKDLSGRSVVSQQDLDDAQSTYLQAVAEVAVARSDLRTARINLDRTTIVAPISGRIGTSAVNAGSLVTASQTQALATIRQVDPVYVDLTETSGNLLRFRNRLQEGGVVPLIGPGTTPEVRISFSDGTAYGEVGTIDSAEQFVSETTSSFTIRSRFANPDRMLLPGMYVRASIGIASDSKAFLLPQRAVSRNSKGEATARFVKADGTAETRVIQTSTNVGTNWLVTGGVSEGDRLIVDGLQKARDGQPLEAVEVALDANGNVQSADPAKAAARASGAATSAAVSANPAKAE